MSIWDRIAEFIATVPGRALSNAIEAIRTLFEGDPELRRRVAFSVAMIALSAKMAKADGVVTHEEVRAFHDIFAIPAAEARNVARLYDLAKTDVAGFEHYARQLARLCAEDGEGDGAIFVDILDGLFHIAKADGMLHGRELGFLERVAAIFDIGQVRFDQILARHAITGHADPFAALGLAPGTPFEEVRLRYRQLVAENHPDRMIARGVPEEFVSIANNRLAAINEAYEAIERGRRALADV